jgi:hypothetical protein
MIDFWHSWIQIWTAGFARLGGQWSLGGLLELLSRYAGGRNKLRTLNLFNMAISGVLVALYPYVARVRRCIYQYV